jgi:hypothetical protein
MKPKDLGKDPGWKGGSSRPWQIVDGLEALCYSLGGPEIGPLSRGGRQNPSCQHSSNGVRSDLLGEP